MRNLCHTNSLFLACHRTVVSKPSLSKIISFLVLKKKISVKFRLNLIQFVFTILKNQLKQYHIHELETLMLTSRLWRCFEKKTSINSNLMLISSLLRCSGFCLWNYIFDTVKTKCSWKRGRNGHLKHISLYNN